MKKILVNTKINYNVQTDEQACSLLEIEVSKFNEIVKYAEISYDPIQLPKKTPGTFRTIHSPRADLKHLQRLILDKILTSIDLPKQVFGYGPKKSIVENARRHSRSEYLMNLDIKDFFPSVHYIKVQRLFEQIGFSDDLSNKLTMLTTLHKSLPQGAPTSLYLSALVLNNLDVRIQNLCIKNRLAYSRYFDDISISGGKRAHDLLDTVRTIVRTEGYKIHESGEKIKMYSPGEEKNVTGIIILPDGTLTVKDINLIEEKINQLIADGVNSLETENLFKEREILHGKVGFIMQVDKQFGKKMRAELDKIDWLI